jgi:hypothetical protein
MFACREQWNGTFIDYTAVYKCVYVHGSGELDITECLTCLSAYSSDPYRVMALCLEERADH